MRVIGGARVLLTTDAIGGVWIYTLDLAVGLSAAGATVRIAALGPSLSQEQRTEARRLRLDLVETGYALEWLAGDVAEMRVAGSGIARLTRTWGADLVHLHSPALAAGQDFGCAIVASNHGCVATWWAAVRRDQMPADFVWRARLIHDGMLAADLNLAPTSAHGAAVRAIYDLAVAPTVIHNGRSHMDGLVDATEQDTILTAGRLWDEGKNVVALDRAAAFLRWPLYAAGEMTGPNDMRAAFANIKVVGRQSEAMMRRRYAARPIYAAPALFEPFGLAVLEAAQAGCALVLNDIPTFRELWQGAAFFVDAEDEKALAGGIRTLIEDRAQRRTLGRAARERASVYSLDAMVAATIEAYARCFRYAAPAKTALSA